MRIWGVVRADGRVICDSRDSARRVLGVLVSWTGRWRCVAVRLAGEGRGVHGLWWCGMGWRLVIGTGGVGRWRIIANRWHFRFVGMCLVAV